MPMAGPCGGKARVLPPAKPPHGGVEKEKGDDPRDRRKSRRARQWYRPKRFLNRATNRRSERLPPSIKTNVEEVIRVVRQIPLPLSSLLIEDVQVDIARLNNPELEGSQYQEPTRLDENLRIACLMRDGYTCQQCGKQGGRLQAHHLVYREHGGKDTISNLLTLCEPCHTKLHQGKITLKVKGP